MPRCRVSPGSAAVAVLACALAVAACRDDPATPEPPGPGVTITVNGSRHGALPGLTLSFEATVENATNPAVIWRTSDAAVAAITLVGETGVSITAGIPGDATVTAIAVQDTMQQAHIEIRVGTIVVSGLHLVPEALDLAVGDTFRLEARSVPGPQSPQWESSGIHAAYWSSSAPEVASIDSSGTVRAHADGTAIITAVLVYNPQRSVTAPVRVGATGPATITLDRSSQTLQIDRTALVTATVHNHANTAVIWRTADSTIARVTPRAGSVGPRRADVHGVARGETLITALSAADTTQRVELLVAVIEMDVARSLTVEPRYIDLEPGQTAQVRASAFNFTVWPHWQSADPAVATAAGQTVTAHARGSTILTATDPQDPAVRGDVFVRVGAPQPLVLAQLGLGRLDGRNSAALAVRGDRAYTSTWGTATQPGSALHVWDVAGDVPLLVDSLRVPGATLAGDVQISADGALLVVAIGNTPNGAIVIYDRSDPTRPALIGQYSALNTRAGVHRVKLGSVDGRHYAFLSVDAGTLPSQLVIVDITDPAEPVEVWALSLDITDVRDVYVRDGIMFVTLFHHGLRIYDIGGGGRGGSPAAPVLLGSIYTRSGHIHNARWFHDPHTGSKRYVFLSERRGDIAKRTSGGDVHVIDISDMSNPVQVAQYGVSGAGAHELSLDEASGVLYAAFYNGGVRAIDVRGDLGGCAATARNQRGYCDLRMMDRELATAVPESAFVWGVAHQGTRVFASDMNAGLYSFDASPLKR